MTAASSGQRRTDIVLPSYRPDGVIDFRGIEFETQIKGPEPIKDPALFRFTPQLRRRSEQVPVPETAG